MKITKSGALLVLFILLAGCSSQKVSVPAPYSIVCFGNSLTFGKGASEGGSYPFYLSRMVKQRVFNAGVNGDTTRDALLRIKKDVLRLRPGLVIIELGGNDYLRGISLEETLRNMDKIISILEKAGIQVAVCDVFDYPFMHRYRTAFFQLCRRKKCLFIAHVLEGIIDNGALMSDSIHPNEQGYRVMAERIYKAVKKILPPAS